MRSQLLITGLQGFLEFNNLSVLTKGGLRSLFTNITTQTYADNRVHAIPDQTENYNDPIMAPYLRRGIGRPKKARRKGVEEPKTSGGVRKQYHQLRCRNCGHPGHNSRTCKGVPVGSGRGKGVGSRNGGQGRGRGGRGGGQGMDGQGKRRQGTSGQGKGRAIAISSNFQVFHCSILVLHYQSLSVLLFYFIISQLVPKVDVKIGVLKEEEVNVWMDKAEQAKAGVAKEGEGLLILSYGT
ncbi:hypothetical protein RHMOL_Rhmol07G0181100 [Rhododendron molle]|uniref:Uncharacterized protein n=1 Tax=Rhododendron molle TaxID=49168 RepID=A0ACC0N320_RHOML|nr:hypothetical protein RHMOL_Rhmol07G0181100 [Rhododendron molle]